MKKYKIIAMAISCIALFNACEDEEIISAPTIPPAQVGDEIIFGGRAGFENADPKTRTEYSGVRYEYPTESGKYFERIDWIKGDKIEIHSPQAGNGPTAHYEILGYEDETNENEGETGKGSDYAHLERIGESALQWGVGESLDANGDGDYDDEGEYEGRHTFYAMYPSSEMFRPVTNGVYGEIPITLKQGIKMEGTTVHGIVPLAQNPVLIEKSTNGYIAKPDMDYAYMVAKNIAYVNDGAVSLSFVPIVTAVEIELKMTDEVPTGATSITPINIAEIQVEGIGIAGAFTADLSDTGWPSGSSYPTCANDVQDKGSTQIIQIPVWKEGKALTLSKGESLKFTVFLRPGADIENLKVNISDTGAGYVSQTIGSENSKVTVKKNLKNIFKNLMLPAKSISFDASKWMSQLPDNTQMKKLSLPGTGGSFSYNYNSTNPNWYKQQTLTLDQQWAKGIRAFEIVSERPSTASTSLGDEYVKCNRTSMGVTVSSVLTTLLKKVSDNANETAVLILTYQPEGSGRARNASSYASSLKVMYDALTEEQQSQIILYKPELTLAEARGKIMILCRINQKDESDNGTFSVATDSLAGTNILLINGCGTGKDRWGSRGYKVKGNVAYDAANTSDANKSVDYYLTQYDAASGISFDWQWHNWSENVTVPVPTDGDMNFSFETNYENIICWYQEWARVVPPSLIDSNLGWYQIYNKGLGIIDIYADVRWFESYNEKLADATETFRMAISDDYPNYVFVNSLCGYIVDDGIESSYTIFNGSNTGGIAGNIKGLADMINPAFHSYVLQSGFEETTGPTGIVMMDYVSNDPNEEASYSLPGVIISNNFKY